MYKVYRIVYRKPRGINSKHFKQFCEFRYYENLKREMNKVKREIKRNNSNPKLREQRSIQSKKNWLYRYNERR